MATTANRPNRGRFFGAKVALSRALGAASRRSGRGGGTTLPGRVLLRLEPEAIARLGKGLEGGRTIVSATNGKTTTAGMIAAILAADGRRPVHNRAGSNMTWGVATALLEQRGSEGLFEVDEAWLPRVSEQLRPSPDRPRQPLPRPARPLRRDGGAGRRVGEDGGGARRVDPVRAQRRRPADRRPRPRPRGRPARGRPLLRDRGPLAGAAGAAARLRRQALPPLRPSLRLRARLRRPPRSLLLPQLRGRAAAAGGGGDRDRAAGHGRLAVAGSNPVRGDRAGTAPSRSLQRLQRARGDRRRTPPRGRAGSHRRCPRRDTRRLRPGRDDPGRRRPGLDPADQEPGRRQRGAADADAGGPRRRPDRPLDRAQRPHCRRPRRLLDLGRRLRAAVRRRPPRRLLGDAGAGDGAAAEVRRLAGGGDRGRGGDRDLAGRSRRRC